MEIFIISTVFIHTQHIINLKNMKTYLHDYCRIAIPEEHEKIKYLPGEKSLKAPFIICADLECLLKKHNIVKIILKLLIQRKKLSINLQIRMVFNMLV